MKFQIVLWPILFLLPGCGPGMLDYTDQIGTTPYQIARTDSRSHWLVPMQDCLNCPGIDRDVLKYRWNKSAIAIRRQVVKDFRCDGPMTISQYMNAYEQYVIVLKSNTLIGPLSIAQYRDFVSKNAVLLDGIDLLGKED